ncbi:hypothetical protein SESBI_17838 [Sesbania bispinosa]|nr:hypothetical protein SESBI_17838 [Sesbania bispinosa]
MQTAPCEIKERFLANFLADEFLHSVDGDFGRIVEVIYHDGFVTVEQKLMDDVAADYKRELFGLA